MEFGVFILAQQRGSISPSAPNTAGTTQLL